ncbi:antibiotic biosynthesis monooxygenase [Neobacillus niacini]|uniref:antibiotic biosynthesis monooxygenase family protein n=1 Tax=Neobacillus niacini TaxID=86668 RepID=UPI001F1CFBF0|nr:antibiotic biosynthesis monooxygenase [Neobacillus niacini]MEC1524061.1 antibiotic biosynthesis monooxygenase [Neobacillus niacini]
MKMNVYITTGTFEYLKGIEMTYPSESMATMVNQDGALLLHETSKTSVFKEPRKYEILESSGLIGKEGFAVINNIPITEESVPLFEHQFKDLPSLLEKEKGFIAIRVLRPLSSNTYIILTIWESAITFENRKTLLDSEIKKAYENVKHSHIFTSAPYVSKYTIVTPQ